MAKQAKTLCGQKVLITGASRGIGLAMAQAFASQGATVLMMARDQVRLEREAAKMTLAGHRAWFHALDVTDDTSVETAIGAARAAHGPIDIVINNAGSYQQRAFVDDDLATAQAEMAVNYFGALRLIRATLSEMRARNSGTIINVASVTGRVGTPAMANYSATKAALGIFTQALRGELRQTGIRVVLFVPGHTTTAHGEAMRFDHVPLQSPEQVAQEAVRAALAQPRIHVSGIGNRIFLRLSELFPSWAERVMINSTTAALQPQPAR